jgi:enamine deaminase RidA (YjgF/YER057c/UK114 family)
MGAEAHAQAEGIVFTDDAAKGYLNMAARSGNLLFLSGHVSTLKGKVGADVSVEQGYDAAREVGVELLKSVHQEVGSLDGVRVIKLLGCVNSTLDFTDHHLVINGASDLLHKVFGKDGDGFHARSAVGFAQLPTGVAVEIEAIFEVPAG